MTVQELIDELEAIKDKANYVGVAEENADNDMVYDIVGIDLYGMSATIKFK